MFSCLRCYTKDSYTPNNPPTKSTEIPTEPLKNDKLGKKPRYLLPKVVLPIPHKDKDANITNGHVIQTEDAPRNETEEPQDSVVIIDERIPEKQEIQPVKDGITDHKESSNNLQKEQEQMTKIQSVKEEIQPVKDGITDHKDSSNNLQKEQEQKTKIQPVKEDLTEILNATQKNTPIILIEPADDKKPEESTEENEKKSEVTPEETNLPENSPTNVDSGSEHLAHGPIDTKSNQDQPIQNITLETQSKSTQIIDTTHIDVIAPQNTPPVHARRYVPPSVEENPQEAKKSEPKMEQPEIDQKIRFSEQSVAGPDNEERTDPPSQNITVETQSKSTQIIDTTHIDEIAPQNTPPVHARRYVPPTVAEKTQEAKQPEPKMEQPETDQEDRFSEQNVVSPGEEERTENIEKHASFSSVLETIPPDYHNISESDDDLGNISSSRTSSSEVAPEPEEADVENSEKRKKGFIQTVDINNVLEINVHPKSEDEKLCIKNAIAANEFLENILKENNLDVIIDAMYPRELNDGDVVIEEGEPGNHLYISDHGTFEVYIANKLVNTFSDKRVFGELAVLYNSRRMATIKAASSGKVWVLHRTIYQQSLVKDAIKYIEETKSFLAKVPLVNQLKEDKLNKIANLLRKEFFKTGKVIVQEGDEGDKFYIIRAGSVAVTKEGEGKVAELSRGAFFGERALLYADRRQATVTAEGPVECLTLTRSEFVEHFDDKVLEHPGTIEPQEEVTRPDPVQPSGRYSDIEINSLTIVRTLGVGGFGRVELVQHKRDETLTFALKYLRKVDMVQQGQVEHVFNEKNIQIQCDSTFIVNMYKTFQDGKYLYFLMESCLGGDLWSFLQKRRNKCVPNQDARFYAACVLEALAYLHDRNFIFRDLKPENLLIDSQGYLKLTDFGFAKHLGSTAKTFTFAGTPEYVAPEIIYNKGHDKAVDYWAFGVLIFELLVGRTPFRAGDDHMKTYNRILKGINSVQFPPNVSRSACSIIVKLCRATPMERLGAQKNGIADIRAHKWFHGFEWNKLRERRMKAPFAPKLSSNIDTRYFEYFKPDTDIPPEEPTEFRSF